uniref:VanZ-like domain-containing protein n=1 Tax=Desulfacinum infernum TaxID=35837 RepID=A0A832EEN6_9BACT
MNRRVWPVLLVFYMALLTALSLAPMDSYALTPRFLVDISPNLQNLMHGPCFGLLAFLSLMTFSCSKAPGRLALVILVGTGVILFSTVLELLQSFVPGRYASLSDMLFNIVGIVSVLLIWSLLDHARSTHGPHPTGNQPAAKS